MADLLAAVASFAATRWVAQRYRSRAAFERWQGRQVRHWLDHHLPKAAFYGKAPAKLDDLPVTDKALTMARFADFNRHGISAETVWQAIRTGGRLGDFTCGMSTGTSGNRGLFIVSEAENYRWLGAMLAKALPDVWRHRDRVAIILPQSTRLYESANRTRWLTLRFFATGDGVDGWRGEIEAFAPTVIVAPPSILRQFVEDGFALHPRKVFSAAETLDPVDRVIIEAGFGQRLHQIYMATEGLLGVTCAEGTLHLAEDSVFFEFEPVAAGLVSPLITSFRRETQIMARYRMNDVLRLSETPCRCGSPLQAVEEIIGRMDDVFDFGGTRVTPDVLRNAIVDADRAISDFRLTQEGPDQVILLLDPALPEEVAQRALAAVLAVLAKRGVEATVQLRRGPMEATPGQKLRRIRKSF